MIRREILIALGIDLQRHDNSLFRPLECQKRLILEVPFMENF